MSVVVAQARSAHASSPGDAGQSGESRRPADEDLGRQTVVAVWGWDEDLRVAADAYRKDHPQVRFKFLVHESRKIEEFCRGKVDLLAYASRYSDYLGGDEYRLFRETFPTAPPETTVAYRPLAVAVHPENPLTEISRRQLRLLAAERGRTWKDLGRAHDGAVRVYVLRTHHVARAILGKHDPGSTLGTYRVPGREWIERMHETLAEDRDGMALWYHERRLAASGLKVLPLVPDDGGRPVRPNDAAGVASGRYWLRTPLKIMVRPEAGESARRFARWLTAPEAGKAMLEAHQRSLLSARYPTPIAHASLAAEDVPGPEPDGALAVPLPAPAPAVRVDGAAAVLPTEPLSMHFLMADASHHALYEQTIFEAVERDGRLDLVDRTELERILEERKLELLDPQASPAEPLIAADVFVLPCVVTRGDRTCLRIQAIHAPTASLLAELECPINPRDPAEFDPPLSESVGRWWPWVLSALKRVRTRPRWYLLDVYCDRLEEIPDSEAVFNALHRELEQDKRIYLADGPVLTATQQELLMQIIGLSRDRAGGFAPTFDYLADARLEPSGRLHVRVRDGRLNTLDENDFDQPDPAERLDAARRWLRGQVASHPSKVVSDRRSDEARRRWAHVQSRLEYNEACDLGGAYEEFLAASERYEPADLHSARSLPYSQAKSRLGRNGILYWRYLDAARKVDPQVDVAPLEELPPVDKVHRGPFQLRSAAPAVPQKRYLTPKLAAELAREWVRKAAHYRREYQRAEQLVERYLVEERPLSGAYSVRVANVEELDIVAGRYWRHLRRAAQLDPTWEQAALALGPVNGDPVRRSSHAADGVEFAATVERISAQRYFMRRFPESEHFQAVLYAYMQESRAAAKAAARGRIPAGLDGQSVADQHYRQAIEAQLDFNQRYVLTNTIRVPYMAGDARFQHHGHLLGCINSYLEVVRPSPQIQERLVHEWSIRFDAHTEEAPHSDFVRLLVLAHRKEMDRFLDLLRTVQERWPDPQRLPWYTRSSEGARHIVAGDVVRRCLERLCYGTEKRYDRDFYRWTRGEVAASELPWMSPPATE